MASGPRIELPAITRNDKTISLALEPLEHLAASSRHIPSFAKLKAALPFLFPIHIADISSLRLGKASSFYKAMASEEGRNWSISVDGVSSGVTGYSRFTKDNPPINFTYIFDQKWQGQGIGSLTRPALVAHAFEVDQYNSLRTFIDIRNERSLRLARKLGSVCVEHVEQGLGYDMREVHHVYLHNPALELGEAGGVRCLHGPTWQEAQQQTQSVLETAARPGNLPVSIS